MFADKEKDVIHILHISIKSVRKCLKVVASQMIYVNADCLKNLNVDNG